MANTYELIEAQTLSTTAASVTLGSGGTIPQTYTDLKVVFSVRCDQAVVSNSLGINFNSSSTGYYYKSVYGTGTAVGNDQSSNYSKAYCGDYVGTSATSNTFSNIEIYIPNYAGANSKSFSCDSVSENNAAAARANLIAGLWDNSAAITSLVIAPFSGTGNFVQYSTFYLYGIKNS